jgi:hypothetical protein
LESVPEIALMETPRYSVSPPWSFAASRPITPHRAPGSLADSLLEIWRYLTGRQPKPTQRERQLEQAAIERLVAELEDEADETNFPTAKKSKPLTSKSGREEY